MHILVEIEYIEIVTRDGALQGKNRELLVTAVTHTYILVCEHVCS